MAKDRLKAYGLGAEFKLLNASGIRNTFEVNTFDTIIFFACLEHMTIKERLASLKDAWETLPNEGLLIIVETPNRLWYFDDHTSILPFFHWLPDELAFQYSRYSCRANFRELYRDYNVDSKGHFLRRGRGMSFHELEIAISPWCNDTVISSLSSFEGVRNKLRKSKLDRRYKTFLMNVYPNVHEGLFDDYLYLIMKKK